MTNWDRRRAGSPALFSTSGTSFRLNKKSSPVKRGASRTSRASSSSKWPRSKKVPVPATDDHINIVELEETKTTSHDDGVVEDIEVLDDDHDNTSDSDKMYKVLWDIIHNPNLANGPAVTTEGSGQVDTSGVAPEDIAKLKHAAAEALSKEAPIAPIGPSKHQPQILFQRPFGEQPPAPSVTSRLKTVPPASTAAAPSRMAPKASDPHLSEEPHQPSFDAYQNEQPLSGGDSRSFDRMIVDSFVTVGAKRRGIIFPSTGNSQVHSVANTFSSEVKLPAQPGTSSGLSHHAKSFQANSCGQENQMTQGRHHIPNQRIDAGINQFEFQSRGQEGLRPNKEHCRASTQESDLNFSRQRDINPDQRPTNNNNHRDMVNQISQKVQTWMSDNDVRPGQTPTDEVETISDHSQESIQTMTSSIPSSAGKLAAATAASSTKTKKVLDSSDETFAFVESYFRDLKEKEEDKKRENEEERKKKAAENVVTIDSDDDDEIIIEEPPPKPTQEVVDICDSD